MCCAGLTSSSSRGFAPRPRRSRGKMGWRCSAIRSLRAATTWPTTTRSSQVRDLLRAHGVRVVMAGDTHDLEYYQETVSGASGPTTVHHWVNGGGGAYLSFGSGWRPATPDLSTGLLSESGQRRREDRHLHAVVEGPPGCGRGASGRGHRLPNGCLRCSTTTWPRSSRASSS